MTVIQEFRTNLAVLLRYTNKIEGLSVVLSILFVSILEGLGIGLIFPIIAIVTNPNIIFENRYLNAVYQVFDFSSTNSFLIFMLVSLAVFFLLKNVTTVFNTYWQSRYTLRNSAKFSSEMLRLYMSAPYPMHLRRDVAGIMTVLQDIVSMSFDNVVTSVLVLITEIFAAAAIASVLFFLAPKVTLLTVVILGFGIGMFYLGFRNRYQRLGARMVAIGKQSLSLMRNSISSIKEARILGREKYFSDSYRNSRSEHARLMTFSATLNVVPRAAIETIALTTMLVVIIFIALQDRSNNDLMALFTMFAVASLRLLPSANRILFNLSRIRFADDAWKRTVSEHQTLVKQDLSRAEEHSADTGLTFTDELVLDDVSYIYPDRTEPAIKNISLRLKKGESVAFVGPSGAGKSTLGDLILGLLPPAQGHFYVDGADAFDNLSAWHGRIGYVPQSILILNTTLKHNIAFGLPDEVIDDKAIGRAIKMAHLSDVIAGLPEGVDTPLGEQGVRLSGGQIQRVGIARALYHDPDLLVLDEATSALDSETEQLITEAINDLSGAKTIIVIAHRLSTVKNCDKIVLLKDGAAVATGTFEQLDRENLDFQRLVDSALRQPLNSSKPPSTTPAL
jgi:ATP-binding cassette, subfamily B, bacterial PglK